jgi:hypothetical protein
MATKPDITEPVDQMMIDCMVERDLIRAAIFAAKHRAKHWEPRPYRQEQQWASSPSTTTNSKPSSSR